jgi:hypothetical protein
VQLSSRLRFVPLVAASIPLLGVVGCSSSSSVSSEPSPVKCAVTLSTANVSSEGGAGTITVTTGQECGWDASTQAGWIAGLSPTSGQGSGQVAFSVGPNPQRAERQGEVVVNDARVQVRQEASTCQFTITSSNQDFASPGGTGTVQIAGIQGCPWTARSSVSWITITTTPSGDGNGTVEFRVAFNSQMPRSATVSIANHEFVVTQSGQVPGPTPSPTPAPIPTPTPEPPACTVTVDSRPQAFPYGGGAGTPIGVSSQSGCSWAAHSNASWISITSGASGSGGGSVAFSVAPNTGLARTGTLTIASTTVTVSQVRDPATCRYTLSPGGASLSYTATSVSMGVSTDSDCAWTAQSNSPWISITAGTSGSGNGNVTYAVAQNSGLSRLGGVTVGFSTATVAQARHPATCNYNLNPSGASVGAGGGSGSISVSTDSDCSWVPTVTNSWIAITSGGSGATGPSSISWSVGSNTGPPKTAEIIVMGQSFSITQAGS